MTILQQIRAILLSALSDPNELVRSKTLAFWNDSARTPEDLIPRLVSLTGEMYQPACEAEWLHYASGLSLSLSFFF